MLTDVTLSRRARVVLALAVTLVPLVATACQHPDDGPPGSYPAPPGYYPGPPPPSYYPPPPPQPAPWAPPQQGGASMAPSFGFFCQSDNDLQCPYGLCRGGRCGGCTDASQCKRGAMCAPSPVGLTCWPGPGGSTPPAPLPPPQPGPTPSVPPPVPPAPTSNDPFARARQLCVDRINAYRARVSRAPLGRDGSSEPCADDESRLDAQSNTAHGSFGRCGERAQDACPNYPGPAEDGLLRCLDQMFSEGPGGGHYDNMTNAKYTRVSCGFTALGGSRLWMIQDFQ